MGYVSLISELRESNDWTDSWVWTMFQTCLSTFVRSIDLPKLEESDLTMVARLKTDSEMEVIPKLLCY